MRLRNTLLTLAALAATAPLLRAEGTKQLSPNVGDTTVLLVNNGAYGSFAAVGGPEDSRLQFRLGDPAAEQVFLGWSHGFRTTDSLDRAAAIAPYYYRVLDPGGNVVVAWTRIDAATANLNSRAHVQAGPEPVAGGAGYTPFTYTPAGGAVAGNYTIELSRLDDGTNGGTFFVPRFDVTVATRGGSPAELPGRVFSLNWGLGSPPTVNSGASPYGAFDRPFNGNFYVYSPRGFVSRVDFDGAGFQPLYFNISFNSTGPVSHLEPSANLRSLEDELRTNAEFEIFLQEPSAALYPSGTLGTMLVDADYPRLYGCAGGGEYYVEVAVTAPGIVEVLIDRDGGDGTFTYGTADRLLSYEVTPRAGEGAPYVRQIPWDGLDGLGAAAADVTDLDARVTFSQIPYHLPVYDAEYMLNGFDVTMVRPAPPAGYTFTYQWDDSNITENPAVGEKVELEGCATGCHTWSNFNYGNANTVNTYWFARREATVQVFNRTDPACGCGGAATLTLGGSVFDDRDGSKSLNAGDVGLSGVDVYLYDDANANGLLDGGEALLSTVQSAGDGSYGFSVGTSGTTATADGRTGLSTDDGTELTGSLFTQFEWLGGYTSPSTGNAFAATAGLRFTGLAVPAYATITNAYLEVTGKTLEINSTATGAATVELAAEVASAAPTFSAAARPSTREKTVTRATWTIPSAFVDGTVYQSPDLTTVIQELVNSGVYATGDPIALLGYGTGGSHSFHSAEDGVAGEAPRLVVEYTDYDLPRHYVIRVDSRDFPAGKTFVADTLEAVAFFEPQEYNCFTRFAVGSDRDGDGVADVVDSDNDNDGIPDADEDGGTGFSPTGDADGDGILNYEDDADATPGFITWRDRDGNGVHDAYDADGDGVPDAYDADSDNDGVTDLAEAGGVDTDGDGRVDDPADADGDGLADVYDNNDTDGPLGSGADVTTPGTSALVDRDADGTADGPDADGDGVRDPYDLDSDNDGLTDRAELAAVDADGDGRIDGFADADGDGLADAIDPAHDGPDATAGNDPGAGTPLLVTGADAGDGTPVTPCTGCDADGDGVPDYRDVDSDGDGIPDAVEAGAADVDGDARVDATADADGDGLADVYDSTHDGPDATAGNTPTAGSALPTRDADGDGLADRLDRDSDDDGIPDLLEAVGVDATGDGRVDVTVDTDGDGLPDAYDAAHDGPNAAITSSPTAGTALQTSGADGDDDGLADGPCAECDTDGDGVADAHDLDSDNDGIPDLVEVYGADVDGDGRVDDPTDADGDGIADVVDADDDRTPAAGDGNGALFASAAVGTFADAGTGQYVDHDGDGFPNWRDRDSDGDGIPDFAEAGNAAALDVDQDGRLDTGAAWDEDGDGLADLYDADVTDGPGAGGTTNGTPLIRTNADGNGDGSAMDEGIVGRDTDGDGHPDYRDLDSDGDSVADVVEQAAGNTAADLDAGTLDGRADAGGTDWAVNNQASPLDTDGDGVPDYRDVDSDNDGIRDLVEAVCSTCPTGSGPGGTDANMNGVDDDFEGLTAANATGGSNVGATPIDQAGSDADAVADYLDADTDEDGAPDWTEGFDADGDGEALGDFLAMAETWRTTSGAAAAYPTTDTDGDGIPDWLDNLAGAGVTHAVRPPFLTPGSAYWRDANGNGLADLVDAAVTGATAAPTPDNGGSAELDWRDEATAAPLPVSVIALRAEAKGCELVLDWRVAGEVALDGYVVEFTTDGERFAALGSVAASGAPAYRLDVTPPAQRGYVRLVSIDADGGREAGELVPVTTACGPAAAAKAYPNPLAAGEVLTAELAAAGTVVVADLAGRELLRFPVAGAGVYELPTGRLAPGVYVVAGAGLPAQRLVIR